jgi:hypothetical protein
MQAYRAQVLDQTSQYPNLPCGHNERALERTMRSKLCFALKGQTMEENCCENSNISNAESFQYSF